MLMINNPIPYQPWGRRRGKKYGKFSALKKTYDSYQNGILSAGHKLNKLLWKWMQGYNFSWDQGYTLIHQHSLGREYDRNEFLNIEWDEELPTGTYWDHDACSEHPSVHISDVFSSMAELGIDAPYVLLATPKRYSDMYSVLTMSPTSNRMKSLQKKLFADDASAEDKMIIVLERLNKDLRKFLEGKGFILGGAPLPGALEIDKSGYPAKNYRGYPIYIKGLKPIIPVPKTRKSAD